MMPAEKHSLVPLICRNTWMDGRKDTPGSQPSTTNEEPTSRRRSQEDRGGNKNEGSAASKKQKHSHDSDREVLSLEEQHNDDDQRESTLIPAEDNNLEYLEDYQREMILETLEKEKILRIHMLRKQMELLIDSVRKRSEFEMTKLPSMVLNMPVEEFWLEYNGNHRAVLERRHERRTGTDAEADILRVIGRSIRGNQSGK